MTQKTAKTETRIKARPGRPKLGSSAPSARERILEAASDLFCRYGINAVGVDTIIEDAGTAKATLYKIFGSKEELVCEVLKHEGTIWRQKLFAAIDPHSNDPETALLTIFDVLEEWFSDPEYYGCPFINAVGEHDKLDDTIRQITLEHKTKVLERIEVLAGSCGIKDRSAFSHEFAVLIDGAIVAALVTKDPKIARVAARTASAILQRDIPT